MREGYMEGSMLQRKLKQLEFLGTFRIYLNILHQPFKYNYKSELITKDVETTFQAKNTSRLFQHEDFLTAVAELDLLPLWSPLENGSSYS